MRSSLLFSNKLEFEFRFKDFLLEFVVSAANTYNVHSVLMLTIPDPCASP